MEKKILGISGSFPSSQLLLISLKPVYFELSVHMLFSGEEYTWCNPLCFEVAWHLLLQERITNLAFFSTCSLEGSTDCWTTEQMGVECFKGWELSLNSSHGVCAGLKKFSSGELCGSLQLRVWGKWSGDVGKFRKEKWREKQKVFVKTWVFC